MQTHLLATRGSDTRESPYLIVQVDHLDDDEGQNALIHAPR